MAATKCLVILTITLVSSICSFSANQIQSDKQSKHKGTVKTIHSSHNEIVDCVNFYEQPAFDHPLLKYKKYEHKQEIPEFIRNISSHSSSFKNSSTFQTWNRSGKCPKGTVPILRQLKNNNDILRKRERLSAQTNDELFKREYAIAGVSDNHYYGASGVFNVWKPFVENKDFSAAQIWILNTEGDGDGEGSFEYIEVGWHVFPDKYGDADPRLFTYWTADNYTTTGCYNSDCSGFVYFSSTWTPGGRIKYSEFKAAYQLNIYIEIYRDHQLSDWWLKIGTELVGYWPGELFKNLRNHATNVQWGGDVCIIDTRKNYNSRTEMGSGKFPIEGFKKAAYVYYLQTMQQPSGNFVDQPMHQTYISNPHLYDLHVDEKPTLPGVNFYYGGPGGNRKRQKKSHQRS